MGKRKPKTQKTNKAQNVFSAAEAAKRVRAIERVKNGSPSPSATQYRTYTEAPRSSDKYISDETTISDPNLTSPYYERYQDEKLKNIAYEIESRSAEKIHEIKEHVTTKISTSKTEMLLWMIGTVIVISIGLIGFHFTSLSKISESLESKFRENFSVIQQQIVQIKNDITIIQSEKVQPVNSGDGKKHGGEDRVK